MTSSWYIQIYSFSTLCMQMPWLLWPPDPWDHYQTNCWLSDGLVCTNYPYIVYKYLRLLSLLVDNMHGLNIFISPQLQDSYTIIHPVLWQVSMRCRVSRREVRFNMTGIILCMRPANARRRYTVTPSSIGRVHTQNDSSWNPWTSLSDLVTCYPISSWKPPFHRRHF